MATPMLDWLRDAPLLLAGAALLVAQLAMREAGAIHCTPHMLRHSAAVWMAEARTPMEEIAAYLGHKNPLITARVYAQFHPDYLRRGAKALTW